MPSQFGVLASEYARRIEVPGSVISHELAGNEFSRSPEGGIVFEPQYEEYGARPGGRQFYDRRVSLWNRVGADGGSIERRPQPKIRPRAGAAQQNVAQTALCVRERRLAVRVEFDLSPFATHSASATAACTADRW